MRKIASIAGACVLSACASTPPLSPLPTAELVAVAETVPVGTAGEDAADDPAIWRNAEDPAASLIVATDKKAGLYVYGLDGSERHFAPVGLVNNVDLITLADGRVLVGASERSDPLNARVLLLLLDPQSATLTELARLDAGPGEGYGFCMANADHGVARLYSATKEGRIVEQLVGDMGGWSVIASREFTVPTQPEGCVVDERTNRLYVGEEAAGIWAFDLDSGEGGIMAPIGNGEIIADVEGLAIAPKGKRGGYLLASSQGDNAYAVYDLETYAYVGRFRIVDGAVDGTQETDGIDFVAGDFGADYPGGLFVVQDGVEGRARQNFKLVPGAAIQRALGIDW